MIVTIEIEPPPDTEPVFVAPPLPDTDPGQMFLLEVAQSRIAPPGTEAGEWEDRLIRHYGSMDAAPEAWNVSLWGCVGKYAPSLCFFAGVACPRRLLSVSVCGYSAADVLPRLRRACLSHLSVEDMARVAPLLDRADAEAPGVTPDERERVSYEVREGQE